MQNWEISPKMSSSNEEFLYIGFFHLSDYIITHIVISLGRAKHDDSFSDVHMDINKVTVYGFN